MQGTTSGIIKGSTGGLDCGSYGKKNLGNVWSLWPSNFKACSLTGGLLHTFSQLMVGVAKRPCGALCGYGFRLRAKYGLWCM